MSRSSSSTLRAGAGRAPIELPAELFPTEGFTGVHDDLHARVLLLKSDTSVALVSLELASLPEERVASFREAVSEIAHLPPENVWVCVTHTLSAPHFVAANVRKAEVDGSKNRLLEGAVRTAVQEAASRAAGLLQEARIGAASGVCDVNVCRDVLTSEGWWLGCNERGFSDKSLTVLRFESVGGKPLALLFAHCVRPAVMERPPGAEGEALVTADLAGAACTLVEREYGGDLTAMFFMGAGGDQAPSLTGAGFRYVGKDGSSRQVEVRDHGYVVAEMVGGRLGSAVVQLSEQIECAEFSDRVVAGRTTLEFAGQEPVPTHMVRPLKQHDFTSGARRVETVETITLGDIALVGVRPELCCVTGVSIRELSPFRVTLVLTMVNGGAKYMPDEDSYERVTYEAMSSPFARGSAESLVEEVSELLSRTRQ